eukprot:2550320-Pyramimonas_sp.AAC.1
MAPKASKKAHKSPSESPRRDPDGPRGPPRRCQILQDVPKTAKERFKMDPRKTPRVPQGSVAPTVRLWPD